MAGLPTLIRGTDGRSYRVGKITTGQILSFDGKSLLLGVPAGTPGLHAATHQNGGIDQINVAGLSGLLATPQTPANNSVSTATIQNNAVDLTKLLDIATASFLGRTTAATGDPEVLSATQATALLDVFTGTLKGLSPASGGGTANFLRADGTWAVPASGWAFGTAILDFGASPAVEASIVITGQAAITGTSHVQAWIQRDTTADNGTDEHEQAAMSSTLVCGAIVAGTGFTIFGRMLIGYAIGQFKVHWSYN